MDGLLVSLDQDGTLKSGAVDVAAVLASNVVTTAKINDAAVTAAKVSGIDKSILTTDSNPYKFSVYLSSDQTSISSGVWTKVQLDTERFDTNNNFDNATNYRYTIPVNGFYCILAHLAVTSAGTSTGYQEAAIYKNGTALQFSPRMAASGDANAINRPAIVVFESFTAGDYLELFGLINENGRAFDGGTNLTKLSGFLVSRT
jgi:hypothetical protein